MTYADFIESKRHHGAGCGFSPTFLPDFLFDFQMALVEWAVRQGRGGIFADCGLGKTPMQLVWCENVVRKTNKPVLLVTALAVASQIVEESSRFGIESRRTIDGTVHRGMVNVTHYQRLDRFNPSDFGGVACDESSILKNFDGATKQAVTDFLRNIPYRLLATATAAPNDYVELGTSSEALGYLGHADMLSKFFINTQGNSSHRVQAFKSRFVHDEPGRTWRFKGHAVDHFWRWVCSWSRAIRRPSDLGFSDERFILPPLVENEHVVKARRARDGMLFDLPAKGLHEEREEARRTVQERCERAASLVGHAEQAIAWCHLNDEGDLLTRLIPGAVQVSGSDSDEEKEEALTGFARGQVRVLVTKPKIASFGLNYQNCSHMTFFPSHSFEQYYQAVRRCWRFGQKRPVVVDIVATDGSEGVKANLQRKAKAADEMFSALVAHMNNALAFQREDRFTKREEVPSWL